jgi:hypothetical protein
MREDTKREITVRRNRASGMIRASSGGTHSTGRSDGKRRKQRYTVAEARGGLKRVGGNITE